VFSSLISSLIAFGVAALVIVIAGSRLARELMVSEHICF
jgi:hypothetical protein